MEGGRYRGTLRYVQVCGLYRHLIIDYSNWKVALLRCEQYCVMHNIDIS